MYKVFVYSTPFTGVAVFDTEEKARPHYDSVVALCNNAENINGYRVYLCAGPGGATIIACAGGAKYRPPHLELVSIKQLVSD